MSVTEVLEAVRALTDEERAQVKALIESLPAANASAHDPHTIPPAITDEAERAAILRRMVERMKANPIPADSPRFTREELHERR